jgi:hypothetical protein
MKRLIALILLALSGCDKLEYSEPIRECPLIRVDSKDERHPVTIHIIDMQTFYGKRKR